MFGSFLRWISQLFSLPSKEKGQWRNLHLSGSTGDPVSFVSYAGLSSHGAKTLRAMAKEVYRHYGGSRSFLQRNLRGHTGSYVDFAGSRAWHWLFGALMFLRAWLKKHPERCVVLVGHSTGALVATCLAWLFACSPGSKTVSRVSGVVLIAPAFKLRSQRDIHLLSIVLFFYYLICPLAILGVTVAFPRLFVLGVASLLLHTVVVPGIWIFNGEQRANFRESDSRAYSSAKRRELFMAIMILGFLMTPVALTCIALFLGFAAAKYLYLVFIGLQLARLFFVMVSPDKVKMEPSSSTSYNWLPIITAANLLLLQMLACRVLPRLSLPVLVIEGKDDAVVHLPPSILAKFPRSMVTHLVVEGMGHSEFTVEQQRELAHTVTEWLEENIGGNRPCNASVEVDGECKSLRA